MKAACFVALVLLLASGCEGGGDATQSSDEVYANMTRAEAQSAAEDAGVDILAQFEADTGELTDLQLQVDRLLKGSRGSQDPAWVAVMEVYTDDPGSDPNVTTGFGEFICLNVWKPSPEADLYTSEPYPGECPPT